MEAAECIFLWLRNDSPTGVTFEWRLREWMRCICVKKELERSAEKKPSRYRGKAMRGMENFPLYLPTHPGLHPNTKGREELPQGLMQGHRRDLYGQNLCARVCTRQILCKEFGLLSAWNLNKAWYCTKWRRVLCEVQLLARATLLGLLSSHHSFQQPKNRLKWHCFLGTRNIKLQAIPGMCLFSCEKALNKEQGQQKGCQSTNR